MVATGAICRYMHQNPSAFDPRKYLKEATKAMNEICVARYESFGYGRQRLKNQSTRS